MISIMKLAALFLCWCVCQCSVQLKFKSKIASNKKNNQFGYSFDVNNNTLVIGTPNRGHPGSVIVVEEGETTKIQGPPQEKFFGKSVGVNTHFIVVVGGYVARHSVVVYIYSAGRPYSLKAKIPVHVENLYTAVVVLSTDNTIFINVLYWCRSQHLCSMIHIYKYDQFSSWNRVQKLNFDSASGIKISVCGDHLVIPLPYFDWNRGKVNLYQRTGDMWYLVQTLQPPRPSVKLFGGSVSLDANRLVVTSSNRIPSNTEIFVYKLHTSTGKWIPEGTFQPITYSYTGYDVTIENDMIIVSGNYFKKYDISSVAYKRFVDGGNTTWVEYAVLKGEPWIGSGQFKARVHIQGDIAFTSRCDYGSNHYGTIYVHDLSQIKEHLPLHVAF